MWGPELNLIFKMWTDYGFLKWKYQFFVFIPTIEGNVPQFSVGCFAAFPVCFFALEVFDDDSKISLLICSLRLLIEHVIAAMHVLVTDVHHTTFINIEIHLPLVCQFNKFIDIYLYFRYVIWVSSFVAKFGIICKFCLDHHHIGI